MDKEALYSDLLNVGAHFLAVYFNQTSIHHLAQLAARDDVHRLADRIREGFIERIDRLEEDIAIPILGDGYLEGDEMLAVAASICPKSSQNPSDLNAKVAESREFLAKTQNKLAEIEDKWVPELTKNGYAAQAKGLSNAFQGWCQDISGYVGWLIGF